MAQPTEPKKPSPEESPEGRPGVPNSPDPVEPEPDHFPGYGEPPPDVRRHSPPHVPHREWGPSGKAAG